MRLDVVFDPDVRPEAQHHLRLIPPSAQVDHAELKSALEHYEQALQGEHEARRTHVQLDLELPAAEYKDEVALADAREKGKPDPGPKNAEQHLKAIAEAKRDWGARKIALGRAVERATEAFSQRGDEWEVSLLDERDKLRGVMSELLDGWTRLWGELQRNTANRALARGSATYQSPSVFASSFRVPRVHDGSVIQVADVIEGLRSLAAPQEANQSAVENLEPGAEPTRHAPPSKQPFAGAGSQTVALGAVRDPLRVREWVERDEAAAREAAEAV
jgi:hypothetical protein